MSHIFPANRRVSNHIRERQPTNMRAHNAAMEQRAAEARTYNPHYDAQMRMMRISRVDPFVIPGNGCMGRWLKDEGFVNRETRDTFTVGRTSWTLEGPYGTYELFYDGATDAWLGECTPVRTKETLLRMPVSVDNRERPSEAQWLIDAKIYVGLTEV